MGGQRKARAVDRKHFDSAVDMARALPQHFRPIADTPTLTGEEVESLAQCEAAVETLQAAFWAAGKALHIIRDGRLYRGTHPNFPAYCLDRWDMTEAQANKLIRTWPVAETLFERSSNEPTPIGVGRKLNQAQAWELVPAAEGWDVGAAVRVYETVAEADGVEVTAAVLKGAVKAVPRTEKFDEKVATEAIREYLASIVVQRDDQDDEPDYAARAQKAVPLRWLRTVAQKDRAAAEAYLDHLQDHIDKARAELLPAAE